MNINREWHLKNKMPKNPTLEVRMKWHLSHVRHCSCRKLDGKILSEIRKRYDNKHQDFWIYHTREDHKALDPAIYGLKAISAAAPTDPDAASRERAWQLSRLPPRLKPWLLKWLKTKKANPHKV